MNAKTLTTPLAVGRTLFGIGFLAAPEEMSRGWIGRKAAKQGGTQLMVRALGARDLAIGLGALTAGGDAVRSWAAAGVLSDGLDLVATLTADDIPETARIAVSVIAAASAAIGIAAVVKGPDRM